MTIQTHIAHTALDNKGLSALRAASNQGQDKQETLEAVAGQFESLFIHMLLKNMRKAKLSEGIMDSNQSKLYQDMADQQLAVDLGAKGGLGLKEVIVRQLSQQDPNPIAPSEALSIATVTKQTHRPYWQDKMAKPPDFEELVAQDNPVISQQTAVSKDLTSPSSFVSQLQAAARQAAQKIDVHPAVILSQAALETGWGKQVIQQADGRSSHNLFNIKAGQGWQGDTITVQTVEYRDGVAAKEPATFRVYESYQASFDDYIQLLTTLPRYRDALSVSQDPDAFISQLQAAGYATDPHYADKISRIMRSQVFKPLWAEQQVASLGRQP